MADASDAFTVRETADCVLVEATLSTACTAAEVDAELSSTSLTLSTTNQSMQIALPKPVCEVPVGCTFDVHTHRFCISLRAESSAEQPKRCVS